MPARLHVVAEPAHDGLFLGRQLDAVVLDVGRGGVEILPVLGAGGTIAFVEQVEFQL